MLSHYVCMYEVSVPLHKSCAAKIYQTFRFTVSFPFFPL